MSWDEIFEGASKIEGPYQLVAVVIVLATVTALYYLNRNKRTRDRARSFMVVLFSLALLSLTTVLAFRAIPQPSPPSQKTEDSLQPQDRLITLEPLQSADGQEVEGLIIRCAHQARLVAAVDSDLSGRVSISVDKRPLRVVMDQICNQVGCKWEIAAGSPPALLVTKREKIPKG